MLNIEQVKQARDIAKLRKQIERRHQHDFQIENQTTLIDYLDQFYPQLLQLFEEYLMRQMMDAAQQGNSQLILKTTTIDHESILWKKTLIQHSKLLDQIYEHARELMLSTKTLTAKLAWGRCDVYRLPLNTYQLKFQLNKSTLIPWLRSFDGLEVIDHNEQIILQW